MSWKAATNGQIPDEATVAGHEQTGEPLFLARAAYGGGVHVGRVHPGAAGAQITGSEDSVKAYEVYCGPLAWISAARGEIPENAMKSGQEASGEPLYAARVEYQSAIYLGEVRFGNQDGASFLFDYRDKTVERYEVLVASKG